MSTLKNKLKLKKIASDDFQYIFESPIVITLYNETMNQDLDTDDLEYYSECLDNLKEAVNNEMKEMGNKGLAEYLDDEFLEKVVKSIEVSIEDFKAKTKVITNSELNESNIIKLKEYIEGQFSDGWGEGFEQDVIYHDTERQLDEDEYSEAYDQYLEDPDNNEEPDESDYQIDANIEYYAHFWNSKNFYLKQVK